MKGGMMSDGRNGYYLKDRPTGCFTAWHSTLPVRYR